MSVFTEEEPVTLAPMITEYYELHYSFFDKNKFDELFNETKSHFEINSSRKSCVCLDDSLKKSFNIYKLPLINWTNTIGKIRNKILSEYSNKYSIDYGLVHYYHDNIAKIAWHYDKEALKSNIYSVSIGGTRRFCLRDKITKEVLTFDLEDGDLFVMKIGCQDKYEHCIKSIKAFNEPRISITFRQIEISNLYYTYYPSEMKISISETYPESNNYQKITDTIEKITIGIVSEEKTSIFKITPKEIGVSLIKSNIQKAVRRKLENIALCSTMEMIIAGKSVDLLRRLTIISFEDVCINKYYPIIVWYYVALTGNYELTEYDVSFIFSYVKLLCRIDDFYKDMSFTFKACKLNDICKNVDCVAIYLRQQFGGFGGEKTLMNRIIYGIMNGQVNVCNDEFQLCEYQTYESLNILACAIDFHCFPKMLEKVLSKIKNDNPESELTEDDIKKYIWVYDSNVNVRVKKSDRDYQGLDLEMWESVIRPKCRAYRFQIMRFLDLKRLF